MSEKLSSDAARLCFEPATELASRVRRRDVSPAELVEAFLARIEERNELTNSYVLLLGEEALEKARDAERAVGSGAPLGPLHGVPIAIKDLFDFKAGVKNTFGCVPLKDFVPDEDATYVERLESSGAIVLGKTNTPEFGHRGITDNLLFGPTSTPFATDSPGRNAGGSSGGSAAAVADGLCAVAQGSDGGGSVRIPASFCGVFGFKATYGRVASVTHPNAFLSHTPFIHSGPLSRTVEDAALMLSVMSGPHPRDPLSLPDDGADFVAAARRPIEGMRIAYSEDFGIFPVDGRVRSVVREAVRAFEEAGGRIEEVEVGIPRSHGELCDLWMDEMAVLYAEAVDGLKGLGYDLMGDHEDELVPQFAELLRRGEAISALELKKGDRARTEVLDAVEDVFEGYDLLVTPTLAVPSFENGSDGNTMGPTEIEGQEVDPLLGWCMTHPINYTGHPAASAPAGLTEEGLPVGMQIIGRRFDDASVFAASAALERVRPWHAAYPGLS